MLKKIGFISFNETLTMPKLLCYAVILSLSALCHSEKKTLKKIKYDRVKKLDTIAEDSSTNWPPPPSPDKIRPKKNYRERPSPSTLSLKSRIPEEEAHCSSSTPPPIPHKKSENPTDHEAQAHCSSSTPPPIPHKKSENPTDHEAQAHCSSSTPPPIPHKKSKNPTDHEAQAHCSNTNPAQESLNGYKKCKPKPEDKIHRNQDGYILSDMKLLDEETTSVRTHSILLEILIRLFCCCNFCKRCRGSQ